MMDPQSVTSELKVSDQDAKGPLIQSTCSVEIQITGTREDGQDFHEQGNTEIGSVDGLRDLPSNSSRAERKSLSPIRLAARVRSTLVSYDCPVFLPSRFEATAHWYL
jgi:hypothetical protein